MKASAFFVADHAEAVGGKLYVTGGCWDIVYAAALPAIHNHLSLAMVLHVDWNETNIEHAYRIEIHDEDANNITPEGPAIGAGFEVGRRPGLRHGQEQTVLLVMNLNMFPFTHGGRQKFVLFVNDKVIAEAAFTVEVQNPQSTTG